MESNEKLFFMDIAKSFSDNRHMLEINEIEVKSYLNKCGIPTIDLVANPYVGCPHKCIYCYADFMKRFSNHIEAWGDFVDVKFCDKKITKKSVDGKYITLSTVTDPYNQCEKKYEITKKILLQLLEHDAKIGILTKSDLVLRDIDILKKFSDINVSFSFSSMDDSFAKLVEPRAPSPSRRVEALKILRNAGISTSVFVAPIFPKITAVRDIIDTVAPYVSEIWFDTLNLHGANLHRILKFVEKHYPQHKNIYREIYKDHITDYWDDLYDKIQSYCLKKNIRHKIFFGE